VGTQKTHPEEVGALELAEKGVPKDTKAREVSPTKKWGQVEANGRDLGGQIPFLKVGWMFKKAIRGCSKTATCCGAVEEKNPIKVNCKGRGRDYTKTKNLGKRKDEGKRSHQKMKRIGK